jgi:hypothetical protein
MSESRRLHLNAFIHDIGHHEAAWRLPESDPLATTSIDHYVNLEHCWTRPRSAGERVRL